MWDWTTGNPHRQGAESILLAPCHQGQLSYTCGEGWGHLSRVLGSVLPWGSITSSMQSPARGRVSYPRPVRDRTVSAQPQILAFMVLMTPVVTQAMDISADPGCCWSMDPDMADGSSPFAAPCGYTGHLDCHDPLWQRGPWTPTWIQVTAQPPGIGIAFDNIGSHGHPHRPILPIHVTVLLYSTAI